MLERKQSVIESGFMGHVKAKLRREVYGTESSVSLFQDRVIGPTSELRRSMGYSYE
jgi:hypothetical protein